jgi:hypothetical protein
MFVAIAAPTYDLTGALVLDAQPDSELVGFARRVSRNTTLDGGIVLTDNGYTDSDRSLAVLVKPSLTQLDIITRLAKDYPVLVVTTPEFCVLAACSDITENSGRIRINLMIKSRLSA